MISFQTDNYCMHTLLYLGMMRYSIPTCQPLLELNETCRPGGGSLEINGTFHYPNGIKITLTNSYQVSKFCF